MGTNSKRSAIVAGVAAVLIGGGAAAWAVTGWNIGGSGAAEADAATITPLTATASLGDKLYPGLSTSITLKVTNLNDFPVKLTGTLVPGLFEVSGGPTVAANNKCGDDLKAVGAGVVTKATFPGSPEVGKKSTGTTASDITIGDLPQTCAGLHLKANFTFTAVQHA